MAEAAAEHRSEVAERTRAEHAEVTLAGRLRGAGQVRVLLSDGTWLAGVPADVVEGHVWLEDQPVAHLLPLAAVVAMQSDRQLVGPPSTEVERRLGIGTAVRRLAKDRAFVHIRTGAGEFTGTVERVGADHLELAVHAEQPRPRGQLPRTVIAFRHLLAITVNR